jgi:hypothetical protein
MDLFRNTFDSPSFFELLLSALILGNDDEGDGA